LIFQWGLTDTLPARAPNPLKDVATIRDKAIHPGESVVAIGYPYHGLLTSDFTVTTGIVIRMSPRLHSATIERSVQGSFTASRISLKIGALGSQTLFHSDTAESKADDSTSMILR
jgi:hypothetical protein